MSSERWAALLPKHQIALLPSKGKLYGGTSLAGGEIKIRPYAGPEELLIANMNPMNATQTIGELLDSCIDSSHNFLAKDLTSSDIYFLLTWLRAYSYSSLYDITVSCPVCKNSNMVYEVDLSKLDVKALADEVEFEGKTIKVIEPIIVNLPRSKLKMEVRAPRFADELYANTRANELKGRVRGNPLKTIKRAVAIVKVIDGKDSIDNYLEKEDLLCNYLPSEDIIHLDEALNCFDHGIDTFIELKCRDCSTQLRTKLPLMREFFRPDRSRGHITEEPAEGDL